MAEREMRAAAVIAEYNPFHRGHALQLARTRELFGATHIVAVMSGDFVQRGDCACLSKRTRAEMALRCGADLVVELPLPWCMAGAERFALGGAALAEALGCIDVLSFGSECGDIGLIREAARLASDEKVLALARELTGGGNGMPFAAARTEAVRRLGGEACAAVLSSPNDTLGLEYCRALARLGSKIEPVCVKREGAAHDEHVDVDADGAQTAYPSGAQLRAMLLDDTDISPLLPEAAEPFLEAVGRSDAPADIARADLVILNALRGMDAEAVRRLPDVSEGLEHRITREAAAAKSVAALCDAVSCKRYPRARIRRIVLSALLGITAEQAAGTPPYIRILGMNGRGRELLNAARPTLPVVTRRADAEKLDARGREIFALGMRAADVRGICTPEVQPCGSDAAYRMIVAE